MANIAILGAGGWGTALAVMLNNNGHNVSLWSAVNMAYCRANNIATYRRKSGGGQTFFQDQENQLLPVYKQEL